MRFYYFPLVFLLLAIGIVPTGCFAVKKSPFQTGGPVQPKTRKISAEEERTIMEQTNKMFAVGLTAEQQNDLQAAEWAYLECLQYNEKRGSIKYVGPPYHRLAVIAARQGKMEKSEKYFRKALELGTENVELACDFAQMLLDTNREYEATVVLENALISFPRNQKLLFFLGHTLAIQNREIEALRHLKGSIGEAAAYHELAQILREKGNARGADLMDQKGLLAQQDYRRSLDKLEILRREENLNQELVDEKALALLTYSSKTPKLGSINRRYGDVLGGRTNERLDYRERQAQIPRVNPAQVMAKYGRPKFTDTTDVMFPTLPASNELSNTTSDFVLSTPPAPIPQASIAAKPLEKEEVEMRSAENTPALPPAPAVPPNQRLAAARPSRTVVFPPPMTIHPGEDSAIAALETGQGGSEKTITTPPAELPAQVASVTPSLPKMESAVEPKAESAPIVSESPKIAMRETSVPAGATPVKPAPAALEVGNVKVEDDLFKPATPASPTVEKPVEKKVDPPMPGVSQSEKASSLNLTLEESLFERPTVVAKTASDPTAQIAVMQSVQANPKIPVVSQVSSSVIRQPKEEQKIELPADSNSLQLPMPQLELLTKLDGSVSLQQSLDTPMVRSNPVRGTEIKSNFVLQPEQAKSVEPESSWVPLSPKQENSLATTRTINLAKEKEEKASEETDLRLGAGDKSTVRDSKTVVFGDKTGTLQSSDPALEMTLKKEEKNGSETTPKKLLKVQSEWTSTESLETSKEKAARSLSLSSSPSQTIREAGTRKELTLKL